MEQRHTLRRQIVPERRNSAGRLIALLDLLQVNASYFDAIAPLYGHSPASIPPTLRAELYMEFMTMLSSQYHQFLKDVEDNQELLGPAIDVTKQELEQVAHVIFPLTPTSAPRPLDRGERAVLRLVSSLLPQEDEITNDELSSVEESIEQLKKAVADSTLPKSVRTALAEMVSLSRRALDQYSIYGARGFRAAFKRMLSELMEVYLSEGPKAVQGKTWWKDALEHLKRFDNLAGKLPKYKPLLQAIMVRLLGDDSGFGN